MVNHSQWVALMILISLFAIQTKMQDQTGIKRHEYNSVI